MLVVSLLMGVVGHMQANSHKHRTKGQLMIYEPFSMLTFNYFLRIVSSFVAVAVIITRGLKEGN